MHLLARPGEITAEELALVTGGTRRRYSPYGVHLEPGGGDIGELDAVAEGLAVVQDEGSQLVALALAAAAARRAGRGRWLDLCAGPGGKAALLGGAGRAARRAAGRGRGQPSTAPSWSAARWPGCRSTVHVADGRDAALPTGGFDRVLVDAPCTGLGALRRRPEARWRRSPDDVAGADQAAARAARRRAAARAAGRGGRLRDLLAAPGRDRRRGRPACCAERADVERLDARALLPGVPDLGEGPTVQLWPHRHGTDAMFLALLRRTG